MKTRELAAKWGILQADLNAALASHGYIQKDNVQLKRYRSVLSLTKTLCALLRSAQSRVEGCRQESTERGALEA